MVFIKESNVKEIDKHIKDAHSSKIVEGKLFALHKLIDKKGSKLDAPSNESLHGLKVLEYKKGFYIGYIRTMYKSGHSKLQTFSLKNC